MKSFKGKTIALILVAVMVFSVPAFTTDSAYASDTVTTVGTFAELEAAIDDSSITDIIINKDIVFDKRLNIAENRELTITGVGNPTLSTIDYIGTKHFFLYNYVKLYIKNLTIKGPGPDKSKDLAQNGGLTLGIDNYVEFENVTITDCCNRMTPTVNWNNKGGAITKAGGDSEVVFKNCIIKNNKAEGNGGVVFEDKIKMENCTVFNNASGGYGGVYWSLKYSSSKENYVKNSVFYNNTAGLGGGVAETRTFGVYNCTFYDNKSGRDGGAVILGWTDDVVHNSTFVNNTSGGRGGAVDSGTEIISSTFIGNQCSKEFNGGGIYSADADIKGNIIIGNYIGTGNTPNNLSRSSGDYTLEDADTNLLEYGGSISDLFYTENKSGRLHPVLRNNGGATPTVLPISNTVITNAIPIETYESWFGTGPALTLDQRREPRPDVDNPNFVDYGAIDVLYKSPSSVSFSKDTPKSISSGSTTKLTVITNPSSNIFTDYKWSSSDSSIATVDSNGNVKGIKEGTVKITAQNIYFPNIKAVYEIKVANKVTKIAAPIKTIYLKTKSKYTPAKVLYNGNDITSSKMTWKSSNKKVAKVNSKGKITAVKKGKATITGTTYSGKTIKFKVRVVKSSKAVKSIKISGVKKTMKKGKYTNIKVKINPFKATNVKITFKSSKKSVISVDKAGRLYAKKKGKAKITVKAGGKKKTVTIKVK